MLFEFDAHGHYLDVFTNQETLLAASKASLIGKHVTSVPPADASRQVLEAIAQAMAKERLRTGHRAGAGRKHWFELSATRKKRLDRPRVLVLSRDITERREAEQALLKAREAALLAERDAALPRPLQRRTGGGDVLPVQSVDSINQRFVDLFGYREEDIPAWTTGGCGPIPNRITASGSWTPGSRQSTRRRPPAARC
jgi:PAS domain S-box-containing protein